VETNWHVGIMTRQKNVVFHSIMVDAMEILTDLLLYKNVRVFVLSCACWDIKTIGILTGMVSLGNPIILLLKLYGFHAALSFFLSLECVCQSERCMY